MRNRRIHKLVLAIPIAVALIAPAFAETPASDDPEATYLLEFRIAELEGGETVNTRDYVLRIRDGSEAQIRTGNRVPLRAGDRIEYLEVGLHIDAAIEAHGERIGLDTTVEANSFAAPEPAEHDDAPPVIRIITARLSTEVPLGTPTRIGAIDDVASGSRYDVQVTVTRIE